MRLKRTYWLIYKGKHIDSYFHVLCQLDNGDVGGEQYMVRREDGRIIHVNGYIEIYSGNLPQWKRVKKPLWSL